jgi:hypothetical protein
MTKHDKLWYSDTVLFAWAIDHRQPTCSLPRSSDRFWTWYREVDDTSALHQF